MKANIIAVKNPDGTQHWTASWRGKQIVASTREECVAALAAAADADGMEIKARTAFDPCVRGRLVVPPKSALGWWQLIECVHLTDRILKGKFGM